MVVNWGKKNLVPTLLKFTDPSFVIGRRKVYSVCGHLQMREEVI